MSFPSRPLPLALLLLPPPPPPLLLLRLPLPNEGGAAGPLAFERSTCSLNLRIWIITCMRSALPHSTGRDKGILGVRGWCRHSSRLVCAWLPPVPTPSA